MRVILRMIKLRDLVHFRLNKGNILVNGKIIFKRGMVKRYGLILSDMLDSIKVV